MKKQLLALALSIITTFSAVPIMSANALDPPIKGDVNADWTVNMADLVCMQHYLLGTGELDWVYGIYSADVDNDGKIDIFDYIELRRLVDEWCGLSKNNVEITCTFTRCAVSMVDPMQYFKFDSEAVITSVSELKRYLSPLSVIATTGECIHYEVVSKEVYNDYLERYTDEFFAQNVLLVKFLQGVEEYTFVSAQYDTSGENTCFEIQYYDSSDPNVMYFNPLPPYIAEVAMSKDLWADGDVIWTEVDTPADEIKSRFTRCDKSIPDGVKYGKQDFDSEAVITSVSELKNYFNPYYVMLTTGECVTVEVASQEVIDDYLVRYDEDFFRDNVLLLNYLRDTNSYKFESIQYNDSTLLIEYYDSTPYGLTWHDPLPPYIAEVSIPKKLWADGDVIWKEVEKPSEN